MIAGKRRSAIENLLITIILVIMHVKMNYQKSFRSGVYALCIVLPFLLCGKGLHAQDDAIGKFFGKYVEDSRFTLVSVSPKMFRLLATVDWDSV
jgi:hypothetical protein